MSLLIFTLMICVFGINASNGNISTILYPTLLCIISIDALFPLVLLIYSSLLSFKPIIVPSQQLFIIK